MDADKKIEYDPKMPIYQQIIDRILLNIAQGELAQGQKMQSVRDLAKSFNVNVNTMQKSLEKLTDMGYLRAERTAGRFVTEDAALIARLKDSLPKKLTEEYVQGMAEYGFLPQDIMEYLNKFLEERLKHAKHS